MRNAVLILLLLIGARALAQSDVIINTVTLCIAEGRYNDAEKYLDSLIKTDPKNIDALMMKGNLLLNYSLMQTPAMNLITPDDEYLYSPDLGPLKNPIVLIPREQALKIEKLWKQCIEIDANRLDIREGMCTLYGMADMKSELLAYLPAMEVAGRVKGDDFVYALMQYAQLLSERGDKEGSFEVYKKIASLYPGRASVWCQLATAYQAEADLVDARIFADKAFVKTEEESDMEACGDALDVYSAQGDYTRELAAMKIASMDSALEGYTFYQAIYKYAHKEAKWKDQMKDFLKEYTVAPDSDELYDAAKYMLSPTFKDSYDDFLQLLTYANSDFYTGLITEKAMHDYKDSIQPFLEAAKMMVDCHNFARADSFYTIAGHKKMDDELISVYDLEYGYSLYRAKEYPKAIEQFNKIKDPAFDAVADYFLGQAYLKSGNKTKAISYFQKETESKDVTKYSYLAKLQLDKLAVK